MLPVERIRAALNHKEADRVPFTDNLWATTIERWRREGLPPGVAPEDYFEFEIAQFGPDTSFMLPKVIIDETDEYIIFTDESGATLKNWKHTTSTPELIAFHLTTRERWEELKGNLVFKKRRIKWKDDRPRLKKAHKKGLFTTFSTGIGYDRFSTIMGPMTLLPALLTDPDWITEIFSAHFKLVLECAEEMFGMGYDFAGAFVFDDLGYKNGPFFSTALYRELLQPHHKRLCDFFHARGLKVILHSCGNVRAHIPSLIEAGFDCLQPLEVKAGMDLLELKKEYGDVLSFMGGIDVRKMSHPDPAVIEKEIREKVTFAKKGGGYIYHSDHSVPDDVSFARFRLIRELVLRHGSYSSPHSS
jgi:uroporphyrinogen decarboxylase